MPEKNEPAVDSADEVATVDSMAEPEANPSAEDSSPRTFTLDEVDAAIKKRIDKQNAKHKAETEKMDGKISDLERMLADKEREVEQLKAATMRTEWANAAHERHKSVPVEVLTSEYVRCDSEEDMEAFASLLAEHIGAGSVFKPIARDTGDPKSPKGSQKSGFVKELFNRED